MKMPMPPPSVDAIVQEIRDGNMMEVLPRLFGLYADGIAGEPYLPWDEIRYKRTPEGLTSEQWWLAIKYARQGMHRKLPLQDASGRSLTYSLPDEVLKQTDFVASYASGQIQLSEEVTNPATRDRYLVSQLIDEAITSSQLEGASTSRKVAREMLQSGRAPRNRSEQMIVNNFRAMERIGEARDEKLTLDLIYEIHRIVTEDTLDNPGAAGRFQLPGEDRVAIYDNENNVLHYPPPASELPKRMQHVCDFANAEAGSGYLPGVLRAITLHFMIGYEHPFEDGNGRTARALFYWSMLNQGYWLTEFLTVSQILRKAPGQYARSFLHTELDDNDLTYFFIYHLKVLHRAIDQLHKFLTDKMAEVRELRSTLKLTADNFNQRQIALLHHALKNPTTRYSVQSHKMSHRVSTETARSDLLALERLGLLIRQKVGKRYVFDPVNDIATVIKRLSE